MSYDRHRLGQLRSVSGLGAIDPKALAMVGLAGGLLGAWMLWAMFADRQSAFAGIRRRR
jgi:hypothetical protein